MNTSPLHDYLSEQLKSAESRLPHIHVDGDTEALHQYRVALRRSRSVIRLYCGKGHAMEAIIKPLLRSTNALREIDVFIQGVDPNDYPKVFSALHDERNALYERQWCADTVRTHLNTLHRLREDLKSSSLAFAPATLVATAHSALNAASGARKALKRQSAPAKIHKTRIRYKEARYAMEFLHQSHLDTVVDEIKKCKRILNRYGAIQDAWNQLEFLKAFCNHHRTKECRRLLQARKNELAQMRQRV